MHMLTSLAAAMRCAGARAQLAAGRVVLCGAAVPTVEAVPVPGGGVHLQRARRAGADGLLFAHAGARAHTRMRPNPPDST